MPFIRVDIRKSQGKKTDIKRVIICSCDRCGREIEKRYKIKSLENIVSGKKLVFCDRECLRISLLKGNITNAKIKETCRDVYGFDHHAQADSVKEKIRQSCEENFGCSSYLGTKDCKAQAAKHYESHKEEIDNKRKETLLKRYGVEYATQSEAIKDRIRINCQEKFGVRWPSLKPEVLKRTIEKFSTPEFKVKRHNSLKRSGFYRSHTSTGEERLFILLFERFPLTQRHVNVEKWNIDFFIPEIDCFVNYNGAYWHGKFKSDEDLRVSHTKQSKTILETKRRDREREAWFRTNSRRLIIVWEDDFKRDEIGTISRLIAGEQSV
jgi:hypothetical protein